MGFFSNLFGSDDSTFSYPSIDRYASEQHLDLAAQLRWLANWLNSQPYEDMGWYDGYDMKYINAFKDAIRQLISIISSCEIRRYRAPEVGASEEVALVRNGEVVFMVWAPFYDNRYGFYRAFGIWPHRGAEKKFMIYYNPDNDGHVLVDNAHGVIIDCRTLKVNYIK